MTSRLLVGIVGFALGILLCSFLALTWLVVGYVCFMGALLLMLFAAKRVPLYLAFALLLLGCALGMGRTLLHPSVMPEVFIPLVGTEATIEGKIVADPDIREKNQRLTIEMRTEDAVTHVLVVAPMYPSVRYGETIQVSGKLEEPETFETDSGRTFRYDKFLAKDSIFLVMQRASVEVVGERSGIADSLRGALSDMKFAGIDALATALPEPESSLASGLLLGGKQGLGKDLLDEFIRSGLVHIVVLSGYNVMIVAEFIMRLSALVAKNAAPYAGGISILVFVLMAGAGPASIRAGIMACIAVYARATGRTYDAVRALLLAGILMLLANPLTLAYDPGFQLSFVATLGLIYGAPILERYLSWIRSDFLREIVASTLAAQIAVLPLLLYQNGLFSIVALPANVLVLPFVPVAMLLSFVALLAGLVIPVLAPAIGFPAYLLLAAITTVVSFLANVPLAAFQVPAFPFWLVVVAYALLAYATAKLLRPPVPRSASQRLTS